MNPMAQNARTRFDPFIQEVFFAGLEQHQPGRAWESASGNHAM